MGYPQNSVKNLHFLESHTRLLKTTADDWSDGASVSFPPILAIFLLSFPLNRKSPHHAANKWLKLTSLTPAVQEKISWEWQRSAPNGHEHAPGPTFFKWLDVDFLAAHSLAQSCLYSTQEIIISAPRSSMQGHKFQTETSSVSPLGGIWKRGLGACYAWYLLTVKSRNKAEPSSCPEDRWRGTQKRKGPSPMRSGISKAFILKTWLFDFLF